MTRGSTTERDIVLIEGARLAGRVTDPQGNPIAARVGVRYERGWSLVAETEEDGTFDAQGVSPGDYRLVAEARGYLDGELELGELADGEVRTGLLPRDGPRGRNRRRGALAGRRAGARHPRPAG